MAQRKGPCSSQTINHGRLVQANYHWEKVAELDEPIEYSKAGKKVFVKPRIILLASTDSHCSPLKEGDKSFWFPYWVGTNKEKLKFGGQYSCVIPEEYLVKLLKIAISKKFFRGDSLKELKRSLEGR